MKRPIYLYALAMAGLLLLLKSVEYRYLIYDLPTEYLVGTIALIFTALGLWIGWKLTARPVSAIESAATGRVDVRPVKLRAPASELGISPREQEVLRLIAAGHSNQEIADKLFLSLNTIKKHTSALFSKLEVQRRTQAVEKAKRFGLIE